MWHRSPLRMSQSQCQTKGPKCATWILSCSHRVDNESRKVHGAHCKPKGDLIVLGADDQNQWKAHRFLRSAPILEVKLQGG